MVTVLFFGGEHGTRHGAPRAEVIWSLGRLAAKSVAGWHIGEVVARSEMLSVWSQGCCLVARMKQGVARTRAEVFRSLDRLVAKSVAGGIWSKALRAPRCCQSRRRAVARW